MSRPAFGPRPFSWSLALACFLMAYGAAALAGRTGPSWQITAVPFAHELGFGLLEGPIFGDATPNNVLIMLLIWPAFAWLYLRRRLTLAHARALAWVWLTAAVLLDFFKFVAMCQPLSLTTRVYESYQLWITLIYAAIFASPFLSWWLMRHARAD
jgi:hypothetical protein